MTIHPSFSETCFATSPSVNLGQNARSASQGPARRRRSARVTAAWSYADIACRPREHRAMSVELRARENHAPARMRHRPERCDRRVLSACRPTRVDDAARQPSVFPGAEIDVTA